MGQNLKLNNKEVYFGSVPASVVYFDSNQIKVISPSMPPGSYNLIIPINSTKNSM